MVDYASIEETRRLIRKGRKSDQRFKSLKGCLGSLVKYALVNLIKGWLFMLAIDMAHNHWWYEVPTIGYWWACLIMGLMPNIGYQVSSSEKS